MNFNIKKYIIMVCCVLLLTAVSIPVFNASWTPEANADDNLVPEIIEPEETPTDKVIPSFNNAISAWNYAIDVFNSGKAYSLTASCKATGEIYGVKQAQEIYFDTYFDGTKYLESTKTYCSIDLGKTFVKDAYQDENGMVYYRYTENCDKSGGTASKVVGDFTGKPIENMSFEQYKSNISTVGFNLFSFDVTKHCTEMYFKNMNPNYYEYQISIPENLIYEDYKDNFLKNSDASSVSFKTFTITVVQSKKTGNFLSIQKDEVYTLASPLGLSGINLLTTASTRYTNIKMDLDSLEIKVPFEIKK